jgi:proteasome lid subunit RPN8/RPN11
VTRTLVIAPDLIEAIGEAARRCHPNECCGLIEGTAAKDGWHALAVHETRNVADDPARRFLIDPEVHFRLLRGLRDTDRSIIGCFHSHPAGTARPSDHDRDSAAEDNFLWLIAAVAESGAPEIAAFVFNSGEGQFRPVTLNRSG